MQKVAAMTTGAQIDAAFTARKQPTKLVEPRTPVTPEQRDAIWFTDRHWRDVKWQDWQSHPDAFYAFLPEAFVFYLPSVLIGAMEAPQRELLAADALIGMLDRSPEPYHWDIFMTARLVGLEPAEYEAMKAWVLSRSDAVETSNEDSLTRAYETIDLLAQETVRLRNLLGITQL
jgi:hypothetical protein